MNQEKNLMELSKYFRNNSQFLNVTLNDTGHENFNDLAYMMPKELEMRKMIGNTAKIDSTQIMISKLIEYFIFYCVLK